MKRVTMMFVAAVLFVGANLWSIDLSKQVKDSEAQDAAMKKVEMELIRIMHALRPSNILSVRWIGIDGKSGDEANPAVVLKGEVAHLYFGVEIAVDTVKYDKEFYQPLKALLEQYAERVEVLTAKKFVDEYAKKKDAYQYSTYLVKGPQGMYTVSYLKGTRPKGDIAYRLDNDEVFMGRGGFFESFGKTKIQLQIPSKIGMRAERYELSGNPKFHAALEKALQWYLLRYGKARIVLAAMDKDNKILGEANVIPLNKFDFDKYYKQHEPGSGMGCLLNVFYNARYFYGMLFIDDEFSQSSHKKSRDTFVGRIYARKRLVRGYLRVPKEEVEAIKKIVVLIPEPKAKKPQKTSK